MPYYEVIFETGAHSVAFYDSEQQMKEALSAHHFRAISGGMGQLQTSSSPHPTTGQHVPANHPAERVVAVHEYAEHPGENGRINSAPHESNYEPTPVKTHTLEWLPQTPMPTITQEAGPED